MAVALKLAAVVVAGLALPACAQRGASHGGFSGHAASGFSAPAFRGGFTPTSRFSYAAPPSFGGNRPVAPIYGITNAGRRPIRPEPGRYRGSYLPGYGVYGAAYPFGVEGWIPPEGMYLDSSANNGQAPAAADAGQPVDQGPPPDASYQAYAEPPPRPVPQPAPAPEDAVTLVFKDGRPPEQIHNYALTRTTLYVRDQHKRDIPVADLDLVATEKVNRDAGVEFQLPSAR